MFPLTFYELLLLDYIDQTISLPQELEAQFTGIASSFHQPPGFRSCMARAFARFFKLPDPYDEVSARSFEWMKAYLDATNPTGRAQVARLGQYLRNPIR